MRRGTSAGSTPGGIEVVLIDDWSKVYGTLARLPRFPRRHRIATSSPPPVKRSAVDGSGVLFNGAATPITNGGGSAGSPTAGSPGSRDGSGGAGTAPAGG